MKRQPYCSGFSLIEVVIATAVFATAIVAIIGLMSPLTRRVDDVIDSETAGRLAESIRAELARVGFSDATFLTETPNVQLVANELSDRVRLLTPLSGDVSADHDLDAALPGIAERDRYFRITLNRQFPFTDGISGSLALRALVEWPYQLPTGPGSDTMKATGSEADDSVQTPASARQTIPFFFALSP